VPIALQNLSRSLRYIRLTFRLIWQASSRWTSVWAGLLLIQGFLPAATVLLTKWVVDSVADAIGTGVSWETATPVLIPAALMAGVILLQRVLGSINEWVSTAQAELVGDHVKALIHERASEADFGLYESSDYHDQLEQVNGQASSRTLQLLGNVGGIGQATVTFLSIAAILLGYAWWLPLVLILSAIPAVTVLVRYNRIYHTWWKGSTSRRRLAQYYDLMLTMDGAAAEVRLFGLGAHFRKSYGGLRKALRDERLVLLRRQVVARLGAAGIALVVTALMLGWIGARALRGQATIGDLALFYQAFNQGQGLMGTLLSGMGQMYANTLFLEHLFVFLNQENTVRDPEVATAFPSELRDGVRFENVSFAYPGTDRFALEDFSLYIPAGRTVAIVGENGAGKSTFIKLLCRFYDPTHGRITVDGTDIREFAREELRRRISVMFQFPMRYQMTAAENIGLGDMQGATRERVMEAAEGGGIHDKVTALPMGYDTILGRWFDQGTELSGGEWQRIALARAFLRKAPIVVLDEPTSFMDSWAETEWLKRFRRMVEGRSALLITHRFTTAMQADVIHVMDEGRVIESGSHAELLARGGHYAASWREQMRQADSKEGDGSTVPAPDAGPFREPPLPVL
jgi:ATP-binding cassette, subfamily B, bacterial